jgi:hypothetical protein
MVVATQVILETARIRRWYCRALAGCYEEVVATGMGPELKVAALPLRRGTRLLRPGARDHRMRIRGAGDERLGP